MAIIQPLVADRRNYRVDALLLRRIWSLTKPYWARWAAWPAWLALLFLLIAAAFSSVTVVAMSSSMKTMTDALIGRQQHEFGLALLSYAGFYVLSQYLPFVMGIADVWLSADWRFWLTGYMVDYYLGARTYYDISLKDDLDNPDQRLQESPKPFIQIVSQLPRNVLLRLATVGASTAVLINIDPLVATLILAFSGFQVSVQMLLTVPTVKLAFQSTVAEADLRYGLTHVRENAEAIAFYHGEDAERSHILARLATAILRQRKLGYYNDVVISGVMSLFALAWAIVPFWYLSPRVFSGEITLGVVTQAATAGSLVQSSISMLFSGFFQQLAIAAPEAVRLAQIQERLDEVRTGKNAPDRPQLTIKRTSDRVALHQVSLQTPGGEQQLVRGLNLSVDEHTNLAIVGQTGVGKSSLLRTMAGLWTRGEGRLEMPAPDRCLFLPQRPYMILADLRSQLLYPHNAEVSDARLYEILEAVCLRESVQKHGGLSAVRDWGRVLSLGEQQRIAFARILVSRPRFVFLDEATSAVDFDTETRLYSSLAATGANYVSIGHRLSILDHHTHILTLKAGGEWSLEAHQVTEKRTR